MSKVAERRYPLYFILYTVYSIEEQSCGATLSMPITYPCHVHVHVRARVCGVRALPSCLAGPTSLHCILDCAAGRYYQADFAIFSVQLTATEMAELDGVTAGKRTCTDCFTDECGHLP